MPRQSLRLFLVSSALSILLLAVVLLLAEAHAARVLPQPVVDVSDGGAGSVAPEPVKPRAKPTRRLVYSCTAPALVTFADRPCGAQAVRRELVVQPHVVPAGAAPTIAAGHHSAARERSAVGDPAASELAAGTDETSQHQEACRKLQARLDHVDSQMRAGYPAAQAARLWDRWREAKQGLRDSRC